VPTGLKMTFRAHGRALLSWTRPAPNALRPSTSFVLVYSGRTYTLIGTSKTISGQRTGRTYSFKVKAIGPGGASGFATIKRRRTRA
jgi:hypothetical protein